MTWAGSQTNGYSLRAIPSVEAEKAQPTWMIRHISQAMKLMGRRSMRAAISPGMTSVPPPVAVPPPEVSCDIATLLAAIRYQGVAEKKRVIPLLGCGRQPGRCCWCRERHDAIGDAGY